MARSHSIEEGDIIAIDIPNMKLDVKVSEEELEARRTKWQPREPKVTSGYLAVMHPWLHQETAEQC